MDRIKKLRGSKGKEERKEEGLEDFPPVTKGSEKMMNIVRDILLEV